MEKTNLLDALNRLNAVIRAQEVNYDVHSKMQQDVKMIENFILNKTHED